MESKFITFFFRINYNTKTIMKKVTGIVLLISMFFIFIFLGYSETYITVSELRKSEKEMLNLVNIERGRRVIGKLKFNKVLYKIAMEHNRKMASEDILAHNFPEYKKLDQRMIEQNLYFVAAGENIAFSNVYPSDYIHDGFVKSPPHFENIIDKKFKHCGIAILETDRGFYITQEFADIMLLVSDRIVEVEIEDFIEKNLIFTDKTINEKLSRLYKGKLKNISMDLLKKGSAGEIPIELKGFDLLTIQSNKIEDIKKYISAANITKKYNSFALGITFGRSKKYPGGVFSIAFLLKKAFKNSGTTVEEIEAEIIKKLNKKIRETRGRVFKYDKNLSQVAQKAVTAYFNRDNSLSRNKRYNILAYQFSDPYEIPEEHMGFFFTNYKKKSIGIKILRPEEKGIPANYYLIAFVFRN